MYQPKSKSPFTVSLRAGAYRYEWFNPSTGVVASSGEMPAAAGKRTFAAPFAGDALLYITDNHRSL